MKTFSSVEEAITFLEEVRGFEIHLRKVAKWDIKDEDFSDSFKTDEDLIKYAEEQSEGVDDDEE